MNSAMTRPKCPNCGNRVPALLQIHKDVDRSVRPEPQAIPGAPPISRWRMLCLQCHLWSTFPPEPAADSAASARRT